MKYVIYKANDYAGLMAAAAAYNGLKDTNPDTQYHPITGEQGLPPGIVEGDEVIFVGYQPDKDTLAVLTDLKVNVVDRSNHGSPVAVLTWTYFNSGKTSPDLLLRVDDHAYNRQPRRYGNTDEVMAALCLLPMNLHVFHEVMLDSMVKLQASGAVVLAYQARLRQKYNVDVEEYFQAMGPLAVELSEIEDVKSVGGFTSSFIAHDGNKHHTVEEVTDGE